MLHRIATHVIRDLINYGYAVRAEVDEVKDDRVSIRVVSRPVWITPTSVRIGAWYYLEKLRQEGRAEPVSQFGDPDPKWSSREGAPVLRVRLVKPGIVLELLRPNLALTPPPTD